LAEATKMSCTWLTKQEAAMYLKVRPQTIQLWASNGKLKVARPSKNLVRICLHELLKAIGEEPEDAT
jgi:excisionase family DNA binding protein